MAASTNVDEIPLVQAILKHDLPKQSDTQIKAVGANFSRMCNTSYPVQSGLLNFLAD